MQTKEQQKANDSLIFGLRPVIEALRAGKEVDRLFVQTGLKNELATELMSLLKKNNVPFQYVPVEKLNRLTTKNHQGVVGYISSVVYQKIQDVLPLVFEAGKTPLILILDRITDVRNFGAIARTAECSGVDAIIIPSKGGAQINADAMKTSTGALHTIPVCRENNLKETIHFLRESGLQVVACTEKTKEMYYQQDYTLPVAIIMGSEENGVSPEYLKEVDAQAKIPLRGQISSLNVSVATGVILYEVVRQRLLE
ncbi:MAG TPA: 23S rRNA (guanosine(2251)-2'-O)-methyltransferase RlmB [Bacteroidia bacterium]|jgi:23S rRNA (guanosine2251-2'-O)-methyltransferase|nr:23S rRNA (guanosine(2251)-2'-O)-methyltransferase RlmB [Bacteroidia bacterium]HRG52189.1 23S rRNA (guanosine(2251)-2'-O)-methyltransferase RlmB [Bacteroidia bacterium]